MRARAKPFEPGLEIGHLIVLELEEQYGSVLNTRYRVKFLCCGREGSLTQNAIKHRELMKSKSCRTCHSRRQMDNIHERQKIDAEMRRAARERFMIRWPAPAHLIGKHVHWYDKSHREVE